MQWPQVLCAVSFTTIIDANEEYSGRLSGRKNTFGKNVLAAGCSCFGVNDTCFGVRWLFYQTGALAKLAKKIAESKN